MQKDDVAEIVPNRLVPSGYLPGFALICSLFFLWALANNLNDVLVRQFQKALELDRAQASAIQVAFYLGYFLVALPASAIVRRYGYRAALMLGLTLYAIGAASFWPAADAGRYAPFLVALFVMAAGAACLETAANPYLATYGLPERAAQRMNLAAAFNGIGAVLGPVIGGRFIFSGIEHSQATDRSMSATSLAAYRAYELSLVKTPYLLLAGVVLLAMSALYFVPLPATAAKSSMSGVHGTSLGGIRTVLRDRLLRGAVLAQFCYVGIQVATWSFFIDFVKVLDPAFPERTAAYMLSASLVCFTAGRFIGSALLARVSPARLLFAAAACALALGLLACATSGLVAIVCLAATSFFMSVMFPTIFALGVAGLGREQPTGGALLIMAIVGGAIYPSVVGLIDRASSSLQLAFLFPAASYGVIMLFAWRAMRLPGSSGRSANA